jgi:MFS family permease
MTTATADRITPLRHSDALSSSRPPSQGLMLVALMTAMFMAQFDFFVVNVAAPTIGTKLHAGQGALQLIVAGYAFAYAAGMITGGRLGDLLGHRRLFVSGMAAFTLASGLCGIASTPAELIAARLAQGVGAAAMVPQIFALINTAFEQSERPRAFGWYGATAGLGSIAGQALGGLLIKANLLGLGWRTVFLVNIPIGLLAAPLAQRVLPLARPERRPALDVPGALGLAAAIALVVVPLAFGHSAGWPAWTWISIVAAVPVAALTVWWQRTLSLRGGTPVLALSLFRERAWVAGLAAFASFMGYFASLMFTLTLLLQAGFGLDSVEAGLTFVPMGVTFAATSLIGGRIIARYRTRALIAAALATAAGMASMVAVLADPTIAAGWLIPGLALSGAGNGVILPSLLGTTLAKVEPRHVGAASGTLATGAQFAGAIGVAGVGSIFFAALGGSPNRAAFEGAMQRATGVDIALIGLVIVALVALARTDRRAARS